MQTELEKLHIRIFEERCIKIKANAVILRAIEEKPSVVEREPLDGHCGVDWQGNTFEVIDDSADLIEAIFNGTPLNYGDEEDYEYSLNKLQPYSVTPNEAIEIFALTESLIFRDPESVHRFYDLIREYRSGLKDHHAWDPHSSQDLEEDYEKMTTTIDWLRPLVSRMQGNWAGESILSKIFSDAAKIIKAKVDDTDIVLTKRSTAQAQLADVVTFSDLIGGKK